MVDGTSQRGLVVKKASVLIVLAFVLAGCYSNAYYGRGDQRQNETVFARECEARGGIPFRSYHPSETIYQQVCLSPDALR